MFKYHPNFETPETDTQVWRYMDFVGFVWMLKNSALWFSRADFFEDKWEGAYPEPTIAANKSEGSAGDLIWQGFVKNAAMMRKTIFINSWYAKPYESAAMWQVYAGHGNSIAIRSTVGRLINSIAKDSSQIHLGRVKYIDYKKDVIEGSNAFSPYLRKRLSFEHESEVRLVLWSIEKGNIAFSSNGVNLEELASPPEYAVQVELKELIECVFISPNSKSWFKEIVGDVLCKYGHKNAQLEQSNFDVSPPS